MSFFILRGRSSSVECRFDLRNCISDSIQENPEQSHWKHHSLLRFLSIHKQVYMQIISKSLIQVLLGFFFSITSTYYIHINLSVALSVICVLSAKFGTHVSKIPTFLFCSWTDILGEAGVTVYARWCWYCSAFYYFGFCT